MTIALILLLALFVAAGVYFTVGGGSSPTVFGSGPGGGDTPDQRRE